MQVSTCTRLKAEDDMDHVTIRVERVKLGLLQYRVAAALDIPPATLSAIERGHKPVSSTEAARIVQVMRDLSRKSLAVSSHAA